jgi:hypothetical protein
MVNKSQNKIELYPLGKIKDVIKKTLANDETIQKLLLGENFVLLDNYDITDAIKGTSDNTYEPLIRDSLFIDTTQTETKTYILMDTLISKSEGNKLKLVTIVVNAFCHSSLIRLTDDEKYTFYNQGLYGNRIDCLLDQIVRTIYTLNEEVNKDKNIGIGELKLAPSAQAKIYQPNDKYYGKTLMFEVWDF